MKRFTISLLLMLLAVVIYAQNSLPVTISLGGNVPQGISYQAVVRDASNLIVDNEELEVKITLTAELPTGAVAAEYAETHTVTTNANGLFTLTIGQGTSSQQFSDFDWTIQGAIYKITTQTEYGTGTAQLLSVPFALYAAKAGDIDYTNLLAKLSKKDEVAAVLGLAEFIKRQDIGTELSDYAKIAYVEDTLASYALKSDIPAETNLSGYAKTKEVNDTLDFYVLKTAMNSKQDVIEDLDDIRSGAALGATALQSHQDISGKQDVITDLETIREGAAKGATALQSHQDISGKADKADMTITPGTGANADKATIQLKKGTSATVLTAHQSLEDLQNQIDALQSALENLKLSQIENDKIGDMPMATVTVIVENEDNVATVSFLGKELKSGETTFKVPAYSPVFLSVIMSKYSQYIDDKHWPYDYGYKVTINDKDFDPTLGYYYSIMPYDRSLPDNSRVFSAKGNLSYERGNISFDVSSEANFKSYLLWKYTPTIYFQYEKTPIYKLGSGSVTQNPFDYYATPSDADRNMVNQVIGPFTETINTIKIKVTKSGGSQIVN
ncbi:MAG: hypothetical protein IKR17_07635 [Bacteroidales bacterium]|nr:hypothetical protein [Bacteroidales bacterium]